MKRSLAVGTGVAAVLVMGAAGALAWDYWYSPEARALRVVRGNLIDPDSAKFSEVVHHPETGGTCGLVNAKNRMGGYTGDKLFLVTAKGDFDLAPEEPDDWKPLDDKIKQMEIRVAWLEKALAQCPQPDK